MTDKPKKRKSNFKPLGSIKWKLMLFSVVLCAVVIALVWLMNVQFLVPMYNNNIQNSLEQVADTYGKIVQKYGTIEDENSANGINEQFYNEINELALNDANLSGICLDISDENGDNLLHMHQFSDICILHPTTKNFIGANETINWNTHSTIALRKMVLQDGDISLTLTQNSKDQRIVARNLDNRYTIFVSKDLTRIDEAAEIIATQMPIIAGIVLIVGLIAAYIFSRRFSLPILEISNAAKRVAAGDYSVSVNRRSDDEIGVLSEDFNKMSYELSRSWQLQQELIANISHDLRTPLTLIKGYAETLKDISGNDEEKRNSQLSIIIDETDRLSGIVNGVMELSKINSGNNLPNKVNFDLAQMCEEVALLYEDICIKNKFNLNIVANTPCNINADADQISRVLHNFLSNALHHVGNDGFIQISCTLQADASALVEVIDHGPGIEPQDLPHIFDKYYRARASTGKVGTGLGLSISKAILQNHGFAYGVKSGVGTGSTFWFIAK